jgi:hypothetical protein
MTDSARLFRIFDRYDILARITPGLLAPLVPGISLLIAFPQIISGNIYRNIGSGTVMIGLRNVSTTLRPGDLEFKLGFLVF